MSIIKSRSGVRIGFFAVCAFLAAKSTKFISHYRHNYTWKAREDNFQIFHIKDVSEAGGCGVVFGSGLTCEELDKRKTLITEQSRRFTAQEVID